MQNFILGIFLWIALSWQALYHNLRSWFNAFHQKSRFCFLDWRKSTHCKTLEWSSKIFPGSMSACMENSQKYNPKTPYSPMHETSSLNVYCVLYRSVLCIVYCVLIIYWFQEGCLSIVLETLDMVLGTQYELWKTFWSFPGGEASECTG